MNKILILTKNILAEQQLQKQLQLLNYEVFCSTDIFKNSQMISILQYFPVVMLSETISNLEVAKFLSLIDKGSNLVIRLTAEDSTEENKTEWQEKGMTGWLSKHLSSDAIRENLVLLQSAYYEKRLEQEPKECPQIQKMENRSLQTTTGRIFFSKKEERLFKLLLEAQGSMLSRKEICDILWSEGETDSNRSQLSCIATKIKTKFKSIGYQGETIITKWGQGYALAPTFYSYLTTGQIEDEFPDYLRENALVSSQI